MDIIHDQLSGRHCHVVNKVTLEIGQLAAVDESALRLAFSIITKGTMVEPAVLEIIPVAGLARCNTCQHIVNIARYYDSCPDCGQFALVVTQGEELRLKNLEVS